MIGAVGLRDVPVVLSIPSATASIGFPSLMLFAIDRAEEAFTTKWTNRSCCPPTVVVVVPPIIAPAIGGVIFGPGEAHFMYRISCELAFEEDKRLEGHVGYGVS